MKKGTSPVLALLALLSVLTFIVYGNSQSNLLDSMGLSGPSVPDVGQELPAHNVGFASEVNTFMVELAGEPAALIYARMQGRASDARVAEMTRAQIDNLRSAQIRTLDSIRAMAPNAVELYSIQRVYNGIALKIDARYVAEIRALPGVKAVHPMIPEVLDHTTSVPLLGAPEVWESIGYDLTGDGISVGIIDTGIDYHHTNFGGPGPGTYDLNDTTVITDGLDAYFGPSAIKVVGGYDFVGDAYNAASAATDIPVPDPDPLDCNGHGTHVAGTSAGFGVNSDGTTYAGGYDDVPFSSLRIGPGMAPEADLYALRVFGCEGSTNVTVEAIEWAMDPDGNGDMSDHLDVINMSLGSSYGSEANPSAVASNNAAAAGVIVVTSAGNSGDTYYVTGAPGVAGRALSTAGSVDAGSVLDGFRVNTGALTGVHPANNGSAFDFSTFTALTGTLTYPASQASGCAPFDAANTNLISGTIVLLNWTDGECGSGTRGDNLEAANAIGMLLADNSEVFDLNIFGSDLMPSYSLPLEIGEALSNTLSAEGSISLTLSSEYDNSIVYSAPQFNDTVYNSTSRGPRNGDSFLKPDITAVGVSVFSAAVLTGDEGASFNGTSMASPHVAGMMALLKQQHPTWTVEELKALAMNTATYDIFTGENRSGDEYGPGRNGAGRISAPNSASSNVIAYNGVDEGLVSVSFGQVDVVTGTTVMAEKTIVVANKASVRDINGGTPQTFAVLYEPQVDMPGVTYMVSPSSVSLTAGMTDIITVTMMADGSAMGRGERDATVSATGAGTGLPRHWIGEAAGYVMLVPTTGYYTAELSGDNEVPAVMSPVTATATLTYTLLGTIDYEIEFSDVITISAVGAHIHQGTPNANGGVVVNLNAPAGVYSSTNPLVGTSSVLTDTDVIQQLNTRGTYINIHTDDYPSGEIRGQVINWNTHLRVPVHSVPALVSDMTAVESSLDPGLDATATMSITLQGDGINESDLGSYVTAFELQIMDGDDVDDSLDRVDIQYAGAMSDISTAGSITDTTVYFGISAYDEWTNWFYGYFEVYIDVDEDGSSDYALYMTDFDQDVIVTRVANLNVGGTATSSFVNGVSAGLETYVFNNNVIVMPVAASLIGLGPDNSDFNYYVVSFDPYSFVDVTSVARYDAANPGVDFPNALLGPVHSDADGGTILVDYDRNTMDANGSAGVLLLHHHNGDGARVEAITIDVPEVIYMPFIARN
jgi:subtilisin family serine protease